MSELVVKGFVELKLYRGKTLERVIRGENLIMAAGKNAITHRLVGDGSPPPRPSFVAFGLSGTAVVDTQTTLVSETANIVRAALSVVRSNNLSTYTGTATNAIGAVTVLEMGIFSASPAGTMYARFLPQTFLFEVGLSCLVNWAITIG